MAIKLAPGSFFGQTHENREVNGILFSESVYPPDFQSEMHEHSNPFLAFVLGGDCLERYRHRTSLCAPLTLTVYPDGEQHASRWSPAGGTCFHIEITPVRLEQLRHHVPILTDPIESRGGLSAWLVGRLHREYRRAELVSPLIMESLTLEILAETARNQEWRDDSGVPPWLLLVRELLYDRAAEPLCLGSIAAEVGVDPSHLAQAFRRYHGLTPGDYLRQIRTEMAFRLLKNPAACIETVASLVGFGGARDLTRAFKREFGLSPAAFRASIVAHKSGRRMSNPGL